MESELEFIIGWKVDLKTPEDLSPYFRDDVLSHVELVYEVGGNTASLVLAESPLLTSCFFRFNRSPDCSFINMTRL